MGVSTPSPYSLHAQGVTPRFACRVSTPRARHASLTKPGSGQSWAVVVRGCCRMALVGGEPTLGVPGGGQVSGDPAGPKTADDDFAVVAIDIASVLELRHYFLDG